LPVRAHRQRPDRTIDAVTGRGALEKSPLHRAVNFRARERVRASSNGAVHLQNANAHRRRFKKWVVRFHGVASWRLPNYLGWHWALDGKRVTCVEQLLRIATGRIHR